MDKNTGWMMFYPLNLVECGRGVLYFLIWFARFCTDWKPKLVIKLSFVWCSNRYVRWSVVPCSVQILKHCMSRKDWCNSSSKHFSYISKFAKNKSCFVISFSIYLTVKLKVEIRFVHDCTHKGVLQDYLLCIYVYSTVEAKRLNWFWIATLVRSLA